MHLRNTPMLPETPGANEGNDIQAKFTMWQREAAFFLRVRAYMIASTGGGVALTDGYPELEDPL